VEDRSVKKRQRIIPPAFTKQFSPPGEFLSPVRIHGCREAGDGNLVLWIMTILRIFKKKGSGRIKLRSRLQQSTRGTGIGEADGGKRSKTRAKSLRRGF